METDKDLREKYDHQYEKDVSEWRMLGGKGKAANIMDIAKGLNFKTMIDVGSGDGSVLYWLDKNGFCDDITSVEISKSGVERIKIRNLKSVKEVKLFDGYNIPYEDHTFDLAICSHVIEHVEYPRKLIREIARVSKHQIFEIPIDFSLNVDKKVSYFLSYGHINIYTPQTFRFLLKSEGLDILSFKNRMYAQEVVEVMNKNSSWSQRIKTNIKMLLWNRIKFLRDIKPNVTIVLTTDMGTKLQIMNET